MTEDQIKKFRSHYHSLLEQQRVLNELASQNHETVEDSCVEVIAAEVRRIGETFPGVITGFNPNAHFAFQTNRGTVHYKLAGVRAAIGTAIGQLKSGIEHEKDDSPVTQKRDFRFIQDAALRAILERDYPEIQKAYIAQCWKSVIIISGGAIEAILTDALLQNDARSKATSAAPGKPDIARWDLADLVKVAVELDLVTAGVEKLSHSVREYRNLVHPGNEIRNKLVFGEEEARIALEVLNIVHRHLS